MWLNSRRNYKEITSEERKAYEAVLAKEETGNPFVRRNLYFHYPEAVKHYLSLFPNNHICLEDMKKRDLHAINEDFCELYHRQGTTERDILHFINHDPQAYHIIGSIFGAGGFRVGHHDAYLFPEFRLGNDYRADYLLIGKGSGGYEFIFVELERPNGSVALKNGHLGQVIRGGENQIEDWKLWIDSNFAKLEAFFDSEKQVDKTLPSEFYNYDSSRIHFVVVGGTREDYIDMTYAIRRRKSRENGIVMLHYDNLYDSSEELFERYTF